MEKLLNNKKYQYGDANKFRAFCESIDEYNKWSKTATGATAQEKLVAKACEGVIIEPKLAKTLAVLRNKKDLLSEAEVKVSEDIYQKELKLRENSILNTLADDIKAMLKDNGFEGKNVSSKVIERVFTKRDGSKGSSTVTSRDFPEACKALLDPLNPMLDLPTSVWLATLKPILVSTGEFVIELRFISSYYNQYKDEYSNYVWVVKFTPSDRPVIVVSKSSSYDSTFGLFEFDDEEDEF